jgi:hypothetical protein
VTCPDTLWPHGYKSALFAFDFLLTTEKPEGDQSLKLHPGAAAMVICGKRQFAATNTKYIA